MGRGFYQLLFLLWAFDYTWNSYVTAGVVDSSVRPTLESPRSNAGEGTHVVHTRPGEFHQHTASERNLPATTALLSAGLGSTPATQPTQEAELTRRIMATSEVLVQFSTRLKVAASARRMRRSTGALLGIATAPPSWGGWLGSPSSPTKAVAQLTSTQPMLAQTFLGEPNQTSLSPSLHKHSHTASSPLAVQLTTAKLALTTAPVMPKTFTPTWWTFQKHVTATAKPALTRRPRDPPGTITFSDTTKLTAKTGTFLVTTSISKTTASTPLPSPTTKKTTSVVTVTPSPAPVTILTPTGSPVPTTKPKETSKPLVATKPGAVTDGGSSAGSVVAGLMGGVLFLMLAAIVYIIVRRRHSGQRQINDGTWAGPSPFLDGNSAISSQPQLMADEDADDRPHDSKRISLMGFFPRGFTHRLSHLKEVDEQVLMADVTTGSTFGRAQETELDSTNETPPDQNQDQNQNHGSTQSLSQEPNKELEKCKEPNTDQEKIQEQNEKQIQTQDGMTSNTSTSPPAVESSAPLAAPLEDISLDPAPSEAEATPPPSQLDENHLAPIPILPSLVLQEVDLGPPVSEMDITPPLPSEISFVPPSPPPLPSSA